MQKKSQLSHFMMTNGGGGEIFPFMQALVNMILYIPNKINWFQHTVIKNKFRGWLLVQRKGIVREGRNRAGNMD